MRESADGIFNNLIIIRGAGDLATAVAIRLHNSGFRVVCLEVAKPTVIRRTVSFAQAVFEGQACVEGVHARLVSIDDIDKTFSEDVVPVLIDPAGDAIRILHPAVLIDAIIAKRNLGTSRDMAPFTIALGPGFVAGEDVDCVVETARGHNLARLIYSGSAAPNTGIPGNIVDDSVAVCREVLEVSFLRQAFSDLAWSTGKVAGPDEHFFQQVLSLSNRSR